jgi:hypothetical protein
MARIKVPYNVYALSTDGETYRYVGVTSYADVRKRAIQAMCQRFSSNTRPVNVWIQEEMRKGNRIVATLLEDNCNDFNRERERWWIDHLRSEGFDLVNSQSGGSSGFNQSSWNKGLKLGPRSGETKSKIRASLLGRPGTKHTQEAKDKISSAHKGRKLTVEHREKLSLAHLGNIPWNKGKRSPQK